MLSQASKCWASVSVLVFNSDESTKSRRSPLVTEARILRIKTMIALLLVFPSSLTTLVGQWRQRNLPESSMHFQSFCIAYFLVSVEHASSVTTQKIFWYVRISPENRRFDGKRATKLTSAVNHSKAQCWSKSVAYTRHANAGADLGRGCRGCAPPPPRWPAVF